MRKFLLPVALQILIAPLLYAQDTIIKRDSAQTHIQAKVLNIDEHVLTVDGHQIKYRLWTEKESGVVYTIPVEEVFMITFHDGTSKIFPFSRSTESTKQKLDVADSAVYREQLYSPKH